MLRYTQFTKLPLESDQPQGFQQHFKICSPLVLLENHCSKWWQRKGFMISTVYQSLTSGHFGVRVILNLHEMLIAEVTFFYSVVQKSRVQAAKSSSTWQSKDLGESQQLSSLVGGPWKNAVSAGLSRRVFVQVVSLWCFTLAHFAHQTLRNLLSSSIPHFFPVSFLK